MIKTALVTGASGFVGSHLVDLLLEKGYKVRVLARKGSTLAWVKSKPIEIFDCGFYDFEGLRRAVTGCDYIFHVAGVIKAKTKEGYFEGNQKVTRNLLEAVKHSNTNLKRFVYISSQTATGPSLDGKPVTEATQCKPITTYGLSKRAAELEVIKEKGKIPFTICRAPAVFGPRDPEILIFFQAIKNGIQPLIGFKDKNISLIFVADLVEGILLAAESETAKDQIYFISSEEFYKWRQIGDLTSKLMHKKVLRINIPHFLVYTIAGINQFLSLFRKEATILNIEKARDMVQEDWICDVSKAKTEIGFKQKYDIENALKITIDWYKENGWLK